MVRLHCSECEVVVVNEKQEVGDIEANTWKVRKRKNVTHLS